MSEPALTDWRWSLDERLFHAVNGYDNPALDSLWYAASSPLFGVVSGAVMALWLLAHHRKKAGFKLIQLGAGILVTDLLGARVIKPFVARMRPSFALSADEVRVLLPAGNFGSMPSLHSANAFVVATVMALLVPRAGWVAYPLALLISASRVGVGVHWPSDCLAGALYGVLIGLTVVVPFRLRERSPTPSP